MKRRELFKGIIIGAAALTFGFGVTSAMAQTKGTDKIYATQQVVTLKTDATGNIAGLMNRVVAVQTGTANSVATYNVVTDSIPMAVKASQIAKIAVFSERTASLGDRNVLNFKPLTGNQQSYAGFLKTVGVFNPTTLSATITGTAKGDQVFYYVILNDTYKTALQINPDLVSFSYDPATMPFAISTISKVMAGPAAGAIQYGDYKPATLVFDSKTLTIKGAFNSNILGNLMQAGIDPASIKEVAWNSTATGMYAAARVKGTLSKDAAGNFIFTIPVVAKGGIYKDSGFITLNTTSGTWISLAHKEWTMSANARLTSSTSNMVLYDFNVAP